MDNILFKIKIFSIKQHYHDYIFLYLYCAKFSICKTRDSLKKENFLCVSLILVFSYRDQLWLTMETWSWTGFLTKRRPTTGKRSTSPSLLFQVSLIHDSSIPTKRSPDLLYPVVGLQMAVSQSLESVVEEIMNTFECSCMLMWNKWDRYDGEN